MSKEKQARRQAAGPQFNPMAQQISYGMSPMPGAPPGPGNMNGNPENVTSLGQQPSTMNPMGEENIYRDATGLQYTQTGADVLNPMNAPRSQFMQNTPIGLKNNANAPYNLQPQPPAEGADQMAGMNYAMEAQKRELYTNQYMGLTGLPAEAAAQGAMQDPGTIAPTTSNSSGQFLPPMTSMNPMTPGATPQKTGKKKGKN